MRATSGSPGGKDEKTVYAFVTGGDWPWGEKKSISLKSVGATGQTRVSILGQSDEVLEYRPEVDPKTTWRSDGQGIAITAYRAQRVYNNRRWAESRCPQDHERRSRHGTAGGDH